MQGSLQVEASPKLDLPACLLQLVSRDKEVIPTDAVHPAAPPLSPAQLTFAQERVVLILCLHLGRSVASWHHVICS